VKLTQEQLAIIRHDLNSHAKVLAVAGSGKTTTMVERVEHLVRAHQVPQRAIRVVMFNKRIQEEFDCRVKRKGLDGVRVQTFHSLGNAICSWAVQQGLMAAYTTVEDEQEVEDDIRRAVAELLRRNNLDLATVRDLEDDPGTHVENLRTSISIWKGMMTPPERAGHLSHPVYVQVYAVYEESRRRERKMTFDDMIYEAVELLERNEVARKHLVNRLEHIIVDEFQDVNYSKQRLVQLLAGQTAKVMVVGDDDQCIYEWTGANPAYIRRRFQETFTHFPHAVYQLSRSFRFGPAIAQTAANCIARNTDREVKKLVAHDVAKAGTVELHVAEETGMAKEPVHQVLQLLSEQVPPGEIVVLVRNYVQSFGLQGALFAHRVPFFVDGQTPLVNHFAIRCLRWYLSLVRGLHEPVTEKARDHLLEVVNRPRRYVNKAPFRNAAHEAVGRLTVHDLLKDLPRLSEGIQANAFPNVRKMADDLAAAWQATGGDFRCPRSGHQAASSLIERIDFKAIFSEFQAGGRVDVNMGSLVVFSELLKNSATPLEDVDKFAATFDPTLKKPRDECIKVTTIFKEKGREYDHVILPQVVEGQLPSSVANENQATDKLYPERWPVRSSLIESERRLFYVALTRARKGVYVFTSKQGNQKVSRFIHEAFVPQTAAAVNAAQAVMKNGTALLAQKDSLRRAAQHAELKAGVLNILRDVMHAAPQLRAGGGDAAGGGVVGPAGGLQVPRGVPRRTPGPRRKAGRGSAVLR
jgi:DNA helicase II / ATP-dependent DNA helicase PcrA